MFLHIENRRILSLLLQKTFYYIEFIQLYPDKRAHWFSNILEQFYSAWIESGRRIPNSAQELLDMNKQALQYMISELKQILGPPPVSSQIHHSQNQYTMTYETPPTYNIALEKKQREDKWTSDFSKFQNEYNSLLASPVMPTNGLPYENPDGKIHNMDELMMEKQKMRDMDLAAFSPPPPGSINSSPTLASSSQPRLKIMDTIARADIEQSVLAIKEREDRKTKMVSWSKNDEIQEIPNETAELR